MLFVESFFDVSILYATLNQELRHKVVHKQTFNRFYLLSNSLQT